MVWGIISDESIIDMGMATVLLTPIIEPIRCNVRMMVSLEKSVMEYFRRATVIGNSNGDIA